MLFKECQIQTYLVHRSSHSACRHQNHLATEQFGDLGVREIQDASHPRVTRPLNQNKIVLPRHPIECLLNCGLHRRQIAPLQILPGKHPIHRDRRHRLDR